MTLLLALLSTVIWRGDYETGDLSQWSRVDGLASMLTVANSPVHQGNYALRVELHQGQVSSSGTRNELELGGYPFVEGDEYWYAWSTYFPTTFPSNNTWQVFTQWHHSGCCGSPPLEFDVIGESIEINHNGSQMLWKAPLVRGVWHDFVIHIKWSVNGWIELWYDGQKALDQTSVPTINAGQYNYLKQGLYWNASITSVGVLYHDRTIIGTTMADVAPELLPPPPDAGTPDAGPADAGSPDPDAGVIVDPAPPPAPDPAPVAQTPPSAPPATPVAKTTVGFPSGGCSHTGRGTMIAFAVLMLLVFAVRRRRS
ncbi:MAG: polysaccharide lyase [Myxococcales bacterium]|nr:polysaccharide lyase [Myxococcales bacterium]